MKKICITLIIILLSIAFTLLIFNNKQTKYVKYNGYKLALSVDGNDVDTIPKGNYFLVDYSCINGTTLNWDYRTSTLTSENHYKSDTCKLQFESTPTIYNLTNIGDFIAYSGDSINGCVEPQCSGYNNGQTNEATEKYGTYGYADEYGDHSFRVYGWRVLYKADNSVYIVSAGSPECVKGTRENSTTTITSLNTAVLKYCNVKYLSGGTCDENTAHQFKNSDFYDFTTQYYGSGYHLSDYRGGGSPYCIFIKSKNCGYNDDIIDNGSSYWFGNPYATGMIYWNSEDRIIDNAAKCVGTYGIRPVLKLDSSILATGGTGTMDDPYTISERTTE